MTDASRGADEDVEAEARRLCIAAGRNPDEEVGFYSGLRNPPLRPVWWAFRDAAEMAVAPATDFEDVPHV